MLGNDLFKSNLEALKHLTEKKTTPQHPQGIEDTLWPKGLTRMIWGITWVRIQICSHRSDGFLEFSLSGQKKLNAPVCGWPRKRRFFLFCKLLVKFFWGARFCGAFWENQPEKKIGRRPQRKVSYFVQPICLTDFKGPEMNIYKLSKLGPPKKDCFTVDHEG